jgi:uncharacterized protein
MMPPKVAFKMTEQSTIEREFSPLFAIKDNHTKFVVTTEENWHDNIEGIRHNHIADFLLSSEY